jgi:hypothetical protein
VSDEELFASYSKVLTELVAEGAYVAEVACSLDSSEIEVEDAVEIDVEVASGATTVSHPAEVVLE